jgi:hypothetical protein
LKSSSHHYKEVATALNDPIQDVQRSGVSGADPDLLAGIRSLDSGYQYSGVLGWDEHDGVWTPNKTGWNATLSVITDMGPR